MGERRGRTLPSHFDVRRTSKSSTSTEIDPLPAEYKTLCPSEFHFADFYVCVQHATSASRAHRNRGKFKAKDLGAARTAIENVIADLGRLLHRIRPIGANILRVIEQRTSGERRLHFVTQDTAGKIVGSVPRIDIDLRRRLSAISVFVRA